MALLATGIAVALAVSIAAHFRRKPFVYHEPMEWQAEEYQPNNQED